MTQDITRDQAGRISTLEDFKRETGAKRFKRTKDEMDRQLTPEQALAERVRIALSGEPARKTATVRRAQRGEGEIVIRIVPEPGMEWDPEWALPQGEIVVEQDSKFFSWLDVKMSGPYASRQDPQGDLMQHILDLGIGEVITRLQFPQDIEEYTQ